MLAKGGMRVLAKGVRGRGGCQGECRMGLAEDGMKGLAKDGMRGGQRMV